MKNVELSPEDALRLHVLLAAGVEAVRIDEARPALIALTEAGERILPLHPTTRPERYLQRVKEVLAGHAMGSPGGYPIHLRRWTRMGQASEKYLAALLKLAEPEAVLAVAYAPGLTDELARRVWWALPNAETAKVMLMHPAVQQGLMGSILADYLYEHLSFESDAREAMETVRVILKSGCLPADKRQALLAKARRRPHYLPGFLESCANELPALPARACPHPLPPTAAGEVLAWAYSGLGQSWLELMTLALDRAASHEAVYLLLDLIGQRFAAGAAAEEELTALPQDAAALASLARVTARVAEPVLMRTTAVGPLMRRHLSATLAPILQHLRQLRGET
ncbi:MAG: hypothetical protein N2441_07310 [Rhodocyclaceae bacterium]|nr:hypothetical protein [Rhodocyclaceae bacterium]